MAINLFDGSAKDQKREQKMILDTFRVLMKRLKEQFKVRLFFI